MLATMSSSTSSYYSQQQQHQHYSHWHHREPSASSSSSSSRIAAPASSYATENGGGGVSASGGGGSSSSSAEARSPGVLTATGRKRKRLQRACVACHKAKRRCDGGLPCSNCDFSGRQCTYSDSQGKTVPPTQRTPSTSTQTFSLTQNPHLWQQQQGPASLPTNSPPSAAHHLPPPSPEARSPPLSRAFSPQHSLEPSAEMRRSLLSTFFSQLPAYSTTFDEVAFLRDLSTSEVPNVLLYSIYAVSARYQEQTTSPLPGRDRISAETYAKAARRMLYEESPDTGLTMLDDPQLETSQALCMLAAFELGVGRSRRASIFMSLCHRIIIDIRLHEGIVPPPRRVSSYSETSSSANLARRAHCQRYLGMAWTLDIIIAALSGACPSFRPGEIDTTRGTFASAVNGTTDEVTSSFIHTLGAVDVFAQALEYVRRKSDGAGCEMALHRWAESLPANLVFDLENLGGASTALQGDLLPHRAAAGSNGNGVSRHSVMSVGAAQNWTVMHSLAESATFLVSGMNPSPGAMSRRDAAFKNLVMILETMGSQARQSPFALVPILICSRAPGGHDGPSQARRWLDEAKALWNLGDEQATYEKLVGTTRPFAAPSWSYASNGSGSGGRYAPPPPSSDPSSSPPRRLSPPLIRHHHSGSGYHLPPLVSSSASSGLPSLRFSPPSAGTTPSSDRRLSPPDHPSSISLSLPALPSPSKLYHQSSSTSPTNTRSVDPFRLEGGGRGLGLLASVQR